MADNGENKLYYGDNLDRMRQFDDESVDLIYLDPPFNSKATYNVLFKEFLGVLLRVIIFPYHTSRNHPCPSLSYL